jgi:hypothetical protein
MSVGIPDGATESWVVASDGTTYTGRAVDWQASIATCEAAGKTMALLTFTEPTLAVPVDSLNAVLDAGAVTLVELNGLVDTLRTDVRA